MTLSSYHKEGGSLPEGIILKGIGGFYYIRTADKIYECKARGVFRKDKITPLPGDQVKISIIDEEKLIGNIDEILERTSELVRPAIANVTQIAVVVAAKSPNPDFELLDKLLISASIQGIKAIICINKIDLDEEGTYQKISEAYRKAHYKCLPISSVKDIGFEKLRQELKDNITVFAGQSGVGKSTILNKIMNTMVMETGSISERIERGKHTTRHAELLNLEEGGLIADTPGFSTMELPEIKCEELPLYYHEFDNLTGTCKYTGCSHISEPGCVVKEALEKSLIDTERYERYIKFYNMLKLNKKYNKKV